MGQKVDQHTDEGTHASDDGEDHAGKAEKYDDREQKQIELIYTAASVHKAAERFGETLKHSFSTTLRKTIVAGSKSRLITL